MLYECNEKVVPLEKEILYIKNYIELEKIRLSKNADIEIEVTGNIDNTKVAPLLFIPFIENSFKPVSYTHLDVYKRQVCCCDPCCFRGCFPWCCGTYCFFGKPGGYRDRTTETCGGKNATLVWNR